ncbi:MAG: hypothetical protein Q8P12_05185, partial [bacterium]|nr:hypothetical protein [bacterium]
MKHALFSALILSLLFAPMLVSAVPCGPSGQDNGLNLCYPTFPGAPDINQASNRTIAGIVVWLYTLIVGLSGLAAFVMIVWGGVQWMTSAGNPSRTSEAKDKIQKAL